MQQPMDLETWKRVSLKFSRLRNDPHLRAILPRNYAGCLMGFGGQTARKIQNNLNVYLQIHEVEHAKWGRVMSIKGSPNKQSKAWYECAILLLEGYYETYKLLGFSMDFIFPTELVDLFILQDDFQRMATASHTTIMVKHNCLMRSTERVVRVRTEDLSATSIKNFQKFVYMLSELVNENLKLSLCSTGNKFYLEHADDNITDFIKSDTTNDLVFYPRMEVQHHSPPLSESRTKGEDRFDMEGSEHYSSESDLKGRESGNSSYYDATSEKGEFEEPHSNENEHHNEEIISRNEAYNSSQASMEDEEIHQDEATNEDHINEIDQGELNTKDTLVVDDENQCNIDINNSFMAKGNEECSLNMSREGYSGNLGEESIAAVKDQECERGESNPDTHENIGESSQSKAKDLIEETKSKETKKCGKYKQNVATNQNKEIRSNKEDSDKVNTDENKKVEHEIDLDEKNLPIPSSDRKADDLDQNDHTETESSS